MSARWITLLIIPLCLSLFSSCNQSDTSNATKTTLRLSAEGDPQTLDPRLVRDLASTTPIHMLYEGLMRVGENGEATPALAEEVSVSSDQKVYLFKIRPSSWTDGQPVTANDFEHTWKSILDPHFPSPNAYQLYVIQGARAAKEGKAPLNKVGVKALDDQTLIVHLEQPTPYFLRLTATYFFYPVHSTLRNSSTPSGLNDASIITNGPYKLEQWSRRNELSVVPNPFYWDRENVRLERIALIMVDNPTALQLFQKGGLEWTGSPLSTISTDALASLKNQSQLEVMPAAGIYLFRFNTERPPFNHPKVRLAFAQALNRSDLVEHVLQGNQEPAMGLIPPSFLPATPFFADNNPKLARQLFQEALDGQKIGLQDLPLISLCYPSGERAHKIAQVAQQQWKDALGVSVDLQACESKVFYEELTSNHFQIGIGSWFADFQDPISFLEVFKYKDNGTNNTLWENPRYIELLDNSAVATDHGERSQLLKEAEGILLEEMPIVPLFFSSYNYVKKPSVNGVYFSELGYLDFKHAYLDPTP